MAANLQRELERIAERRSQATRLDTVFQGYRLCARTEGKSVWPKLNKEKAEKLIKLGKMTDAGLIKIEEAKRNGFWDTAYTNKDRDKIPEDLNKALLQNKDAWNNFNNFANSYWNMYIGWVNSAKTEETRKRRIAEVVKRSALNKKPGIV